MTTVRDFTLFLTKNKSARPYKDISFWTFGLSAIASSDNYELFVTKSKPVHQMFQTIRQPWQHELINRGYSINGFCLSFGWTIKTYFRLIFEVSVCCLGVSKSFCSVSIFIQTNFNVIMFEVVAKGIGSTNIKSQMLEYYSKLVVKTTCEVI